jgi:hypothetical protein
MKNKITSKFIFITGGVVSSLGKGITAASIGLLLKSRGLKVINQKFDPYLNIDPGTMNPFQHGEVYVTEDGGETDLDLGHYERFTDVPVRKFNNTTAGKVYLAILDRLLMDFLKILLSCQKARIFSSCSGKFTLGSTGSYMVYYSCL